MKKNNSKKIIIIGTIILIIILVTGYVVKKLNSSYSLPTTLAFEDIGHYAFAIGGSNSAYRGGYIGDKDHRSYIESYPNSVLDIEYDWNTVKENLANDGITFNERLCTSNSSTIPKNCTNMTGSKINFEGKVKKAIFSIVQSDVNSLTEPYTGRILIIRPDGSYFIFPSTANSWVDTFDITNQMLEAEGGWYFVSYLDAKANISQAAWAITIVYENENLDYSYIKLINKNTSIENGQATSVTLDSPLRLKNTFQLVGVITGAGVDAFPQPPNTNDRAFAVLEDGSNYQLYDRGDGHFTGRTSTDFANNTYGAERSHNIAGGELDIFDETLTDAYFGGKNMIGYRFIKDGSNIINISLIGLRQEVYHPDVSIHTELSSNEKFQSGDVVTTRTVVTNTEVENVCSSIYNNVITSSVDTVLSDIRNIKVTYNNQEYTGEYIQALHAVVVEDIEEIACSSDVVITYDGTINDTIYNRIEDNKYNVDTTAKIEYEIETMEDVGSVYTLEDDDSISSYKKVTITTQHVDKNSGEKLTYDVLQDYYYGEHYETEEKHFDTYHLDSTVGNLEGTATNDLIVKYIYDLNRYTITVKYLEKGTSTPLAEPVEKEGVEGTPYTISSKNISGYQLVESPVLEEGVFSSNAEFVYYYQKLVKLVIKHIDKDTSAVLKTETKNNLLKGETYHTSSKQFLNYVLDEESPASRDVTLTDDTTEVKYYYRKIPAGVVVKYIDEYNDEIIENLEISGKVGDTYSTSEKEFDGYVLSRTPDNPTGTMTVEPIEVIYYYKKKAEVVVKYIDELTGEDIQEEEIKEGFVGDDYKANKLEIPGYVLVKEPDNETGKMDYETTEVKYYYRPLVHVITKGSEGGTIVGDEDVTKGYNSTPEKIVITPDNDYFISKILINGEPIIVTDIGGMTLDNFVNMQEDKIVEVEFGQIIHNVPKTSRNSKISMGAILIFGLGICALFIGYRKGKKKILKI